MRWGGPRAVNLPVRCRDQVRSRQRRGPAVGFASPVRFAVLALSLCFASAAVAQNAPAPASPVAPPVAAPSPPANLQKCLQETGDYITRGKAIFYVIGITNTCNTRIRCMIYANVTGARGTSLGHSVMILSPAGSGDDAKKSYDMPVRAAGGIAQVSRECKVI
jgi:hypothetical protein